MDRDEALRLLGRGQSGVAEWNEWRWDSGEKIPDLSRANLRGVDLREVDLRDANLSSTILREAGLIWAKLNRADLSRAELQRANLSGASLILTELAEADVSSADLSDANLNGAGLIRTRLGGCRCGGALFVGVDLSVAEGLEAINHAGPSSIDHRTLAKSRGKIPEEFLRGCGLSDWEIEAAKLYNPDLTPQEFSEIQLRVFDLRQSRPLQVHNVFISYSRIDSAFVDALETKLNTAGIRFWRDIHDAVAGRMDKNVEWGMRANPIVVVVLSEHSVKSDWVEHEVAMAAKLRKELNRDTLCPIALDDAWKTCDWDAPLRTQIQKYNILSFHKWKKPDQFEEMFRRLIKGLDLFYKPEKE